MDHHQEPTRSETGTPTHRAFGDIVRALVAEDPRFVRRVTRTAPGGLGNSVILAGLLAAVVLGVVPLSVGLHTGIVALLVVGAVGCVVLPVAAPLGVRAVLRRRWPSAM